MERFAASGGWRNRTKRAREPKGRSIVRTTWQQPSRLNEADSLSLLLSFTPSLSLSHSLFSFLSVLPPLLSRHSLPRSLPLAPSRTLAASSSLGAAPHRPKSILERRRERGNDGRTKEKDVIQITDQPGFPLISSVSGGHPPARRGRSRARLVSSSLPSSSATSVIAEQDAAKRVSCHVPYTAIAWLARTRAKDRPKLGLPMRHCARCEGGTARKDVCGRERVIIKSPTRRGDAERKVCG